MKPQAPDRWTEMDALFGAALQRPPEERTAFLRAHCGDNPQLYRAVVALLEDEVEAEKVLGESATDFAALLLDAVGEQARADDEVDLAEGTRVGPYRITGELGRGGMGAVYRAERADGTFEKQVALKLVKRGMDTDEVLRRFRHERQILAGLDHPHIARLLDAGAADDGRPFLVMELAEGEPITVYATQQRLETEARMALFEQVCEAVAYAHQHLVVHRDLKPSNILVTHDGSVKLLDFGIAKLLEDDESEALTRPERRLLTPEYAAPEQRRGEAVTTATDVYALGVVLYELLARRRPDDPPRPPSAAAGDRHFRGDVDALVLTALHADLDRRYPSAEALLDDLRRYRTGLPLRARSDTPGYRARRFLGRHRWGVAAAALVGVLLAAFAVTVALQQRQTAQAYSEAEAAAAFLESLFAAADPFAEERLDTLRVRALLDRGAERARTEWTDAPPVRARLLHTIGQTYVRMGLPGEAEPLLREALALRSGAPPPERAASLTALAVVRRVQGAHAEAEALAREALALLGAGGLADAHADARAAAEAELALTLLATGHAEEAAPLMQAAYDQRHASFGPDDARTLDTEVQLASLLLETGRLAESEARYRDVLARLRALDGDPRLRHTAVLDPLAFLLMLTGRAEEAAALSAESLALARDGAPGGTRMRQALVGHAGILRRLGRLGEAEALATEALALPVRRPQDHALALGTLASIRAERGDLAAAAAAQREALTVLRDAFGDGDPVTAHSAVKLAGFLREQRRFEAAEAVLLDTHAALVASGAGSEASGEHGNPNVAAELVVLYEAWGRAEEAARWRSRVDPAAPR